VSCCSLRKGFTVESWRSPSLPVSGEGTSRDWKHKFLNDYHSGPSVGSKKQQAWRQVGPANPLTPTPPSYSAAGLRDARCWRTRGITFSDISRIDL
jgi:hypothetical protein